MTFPCPPSAATGLAARCDTRDRVLLAVTSAVAMAVPLAWVRIPPITDLPQHLAQIKLFLEAWHDPSGPYRIQWLSPYVLPYSIFGLAWATVGPEHAGRLAMALLVMLWVGATHLLAARRRRSAAAATLASIVAMNHTFYWGFTSFYAGWPVFVLWLLAFFRAAERRSPSASAWFGLATLALFLTHALWFAAALAWLAVEAVRDRATRQALARALPALVPVLVLAAWSYLSLRRGGFDTPPHWWILPTGRLSISQLVDSVLGGLRGPVEHMLFGVLVTWVVVGLLHPHERHSTDGVLVRIGALLWAAVVLGPDEMQETLLFAPRWAPAAMVCLLLAVPAPPARPARMRVIAAALVLSYAWITAVAWQRFDRIELDRFPETVRVVPRGARVVELDFEKDSLWIKGRPFLQLAAYAQVLRDAKPAKSFAEMAPMLVVYREMMEPPWHKNIEWFPERLRRDELCHFDYALVHDRSNEIRALMREVRFVPISGPGRWRLYRLECDPA